MATRNEQWTVRNQNPAAFASMYGGSQDTIRGALGLDSAGGTASRAVGVSPSSVDMPPASRYPSANPPARGGRSRRGTSGNQDTPTGPEMLGAFQRDQQSQQEAIDLLRDRQDQALASRSLLYAEGGPIDRLDIQSEELRERMLAPIDHFTTESMDWLEEAREQGRALGPRAEEYMDQAVTSAVDAKEFAMDNYSNQVAQVGLLKIGDLWDKWRGDSELYAATHAGDMTPEQVSQNIYQTKMATLQKSAQIGAQLSIEYETNRARMNESYDNRIAQTINSAQWRATTAYAKGAELETSLATQAARIREYTLHWVEQSELMSARLKQEASNLYARGLVDDANFLAGLDTYTDPSDTELFAFAYGLAEMNYNPPSYSLSVSRGSRRGSGSESLAGPKWYSSAPHAYRPSSPSPEPLGATDDSGELEGATDDTWWGDTEPIIQEAPDENESGGSRDSDED